MSHIQTTLSTPSCQQPTEDIRTHIVQAGMKRTQVHGNRALV